MWRPPNIYGVRHIFPLPQKLQARIQPCSMLRLIPVRVEEGILTSRPLTRHLQPMRNFPGSRCTRCILHIWASLPSQHPIGPDRLSALVRTRGRIGTSLHTHTSHQTLDDHRAEHTSSELQTLQREKTGSKPPKNPVGRQDDSTQQVCRLYS